MTDFLPQEKMAIQSWQQTILAFSKPAYRKAFHKNIDYHSSYIKDLWSVFNEERSHLSAKTLNSQNYALAYLMGFHLPNVSRAQKILERVEARYGSFIHLLPQSDEPIEIFDFGCGTGALSIATLCHLIKSKINPSRVTVHLYDQNSVLLEKAAFGLKSINDQIKIRSCKSSLENLKPSYFQKAGSTKFFLFGYVMNEINNNPKGVGFVHKILDHLGSSTDLGLALFAEPSKKPSSQSMIHLRNHMCGSGWAPLYPCNHAQLCPFSPPSKDWCFSQFDFNKPHWQKMVDKRIPIDRVTLTSSGFFFINKPNVLEHPLQKGPIIVGIPTQKDEEQAKDYLLCSKDGIARIPLKASGKTYQRGEVFTSK